MALVALVVARMAQSLLPPMALDHHAITTRADRAKVWLSGLTMPQPARMAFLRAFDATTSSTLESAAMVTELVQTLTGHVDVGALHELSDLATRLRLYYEKTSSTDVGSHGRP